MEGRRGDKRNRTADMALAFHAVDLSSIPGIPDGLPEATRNDS